MKPYSRSRRARLWLRAGVIAATACAAAPAARADDYRIGPGDGIEIAVAGLPELRQKVNVQPDGAISAPLAGAIPVAGLTPEEMRQRVQRRLADKIFRTRNSDGRDVFTILRADEISASIVEYRPVYVTGAVLKAGEAPYRIGMTVRQAVALAGGYGPIEDRIASPGIEIANLRGEHETVWGDYVAQLSRLARIASELADKDALGKIDPGDAPLPQARIDQIAAMEKQVLEARLRDYRRERDFLQQANKTLIEQTAVLEKQQKEEEQGTRADTAELQKLIDLLGRGQVASPRVVEARRALLLSSTRALQVSAGLLQVQKQMAENARRLEHFQDDRRVALLRETQDATQALNTAMLRRRTVEEKMAQVERARMRLGFDTAQNVEFKLVRRENDAATTTDVDPDFRLKPGDVVEVRANRAGEAMR